MAGLIVSASEIPADEIWYTSSDGGLVTPYEFDGRILTDYENSGFGAYVVSNTYEDGKGIIKFDGDISQIGDGAFYYCSNLKEITIPSSVTYIGKIAFYGCSQLTEMTIPEAVTGIGDRAFYGCSGIAEFTIPKSVNSIGVYPFYLCTGLTSIIVVEDNGTYDSRDNCNAIIETATNTLVAGCDESFIPGTVTAIGDGAFQGCTKMTTMVIPNSVTSIGDGAFSECDCLESLVIPKSVTSIGNNCFLFCSNLTSLSVEEGNSRYDSRDNCNAIIETATNTLIRGLKNTVIPNTVENIGEFAFYQCSGMSGMDIPESVTCISSYAFYYCRDLTSICIPDSVKSIGSAAFYGCTGVKELTVGKSVESIGNNAFFGCSIETLRWRSNMSTKGVTDNWKKSLKKIVLENSAECIEDKAFSGYQFLESITIPNTVKWIGDSAFCECVTMSDFEIPNSVTSIGESAFFRITKLKSLTIPESVTSIGNRAFGYCSNLKSVTVYWNEPLNIQSQTFFRVKNCTLYVPKGSLEAYQNAEVWKGFSSIVEFDTTDVQDAEMKTGIDEVSRYGLNGMKTGAGRAGIQIIRMSDGSTRKEYLR